MAENVYKKLNRIIVTHKLSTRNRARMDRVVIAKPQEKTISSENDLWSLLKILQKPHPQELEVMLRTFWRKYRDLQSPSG